MKSLCSAEQLSTPMSIAKRFRGLGLRSSTCRCNLQKDVANTFASVILEKLIVKLGLFSARTEGVQRFRYLSLISVSQTQVF